MTKLDFKKIFDDWHSFDQKEWSHDRSQTVGASEIFDCLRKTWFKKNNAPKDANHVESWGAMRRGDLIENHHVVPAMDFGLPEDVVFVGGGENQKTFVDLDNRISATPDGLFAGLARDALSEYGIDDIESDSIVFEIKSVDPRTNLKEEKAVHRGQAIAQMGLIREQTNYQPNYAVILYVESSFLDNIKVFTIKFDPDMYENAKRRGRTVYSEENPSNIRPEGKLVNGCGFCPYSEECKKASFLAVPEELTPASSLSDEKTSKLKTLLLAQKAASNAEKLAKKRKDIATQEIKEFMSENKSRGFTFHEEDGNKWGVSWYVSKGRKSLDKEALTNDGIDLDLYMKESSGHDVLKINGISVDDAE